jgi:hypothetical protein
MRYVNGGELFQHMQSVDSSVLLLFYLVYDIIVDDYY